MFANNIQQSIPFNNNMNPNMINNNMILNNNIPNNMMNNYQMGLNYPNMINNNVILNNNPNNNINDTSKMQITFKTTDDKIYVLTVNRGMTIDELLKKYCEDIGHPDYIGTENKIKFIHKAEFLRFGDKTSIQMKFMSREPQKIMVHDVSNLIG